MFGTRIDFQFLDHIMTKSGMREHAPDSSLERIAGILFKPLLERSPSFTTDHAGMMEVLLGVCLVASKENLIGVNDNHEIPGIHIGGADGLVLAHEKASDLGRYAAENLAIRVNELPAALDVIWIHHYGLHIIPQNVVIQGIGGGP